MVCIRVTVGSQDLKAVAVKEPVDLLAKPTKRNRNRANGQLRRK